MLKCAEANRKMYAVSEETDSSVEEKLLLSKSQEESRSSKDWFIKMQTNNSYVACKVDTGEHVNVITETEIGVLSS